MEKLKELLRHPERLSPGDRPLLEETVKTYPWFRAPLLLLMKLALDTGDGKLLADARGRLALRLSAAPFPDYLLTEPDFSEPARAETLEVIERFLGTADKRIVPDENIPDNDLAASSAAHPENEAVSEILAAIYLKQGLTGKALNVYRKLSLKFPEKSVYFADIIEKIEKNNHTNNR